MKRASNHISTMFSNSIWRMKTELLIQMDGLAKSDDLVFVLAVSNLPWTLDSALLRRLEKRIFVPLPNPEARAQMFRSLLPGDKATELPYDVQILKFNTYSSRFLARRPKDILDLTLESFARKQLWFLLEGY
jgi:SpoVK/Ycf46/Vps4 family AAA+-type ATPase